MTDDTEHCRYCTHPRDQHPVYDDNGGLACVGREEWFLDPEGYPHEDMIGAEEALQEFSSALRSFAKVPALSLAELDDDE